VRAAGAAGLAAVLLALTACGTGLSEEELDRILLQADELPPGLELDEEASGPVEEVSDSFIVEGGLDREVEEGFVRGAERTYVAPPSTAGGVAFVGSLGLLFAGVEDAEEFMDFSHGFQLGPGAPEGRELPADGLGDGGYGVHYPPDRGGGESYGYIWRVEGLVLVVAVGGSAGSIDGSRVLLLAETVDDRVP
jgi:hypothetical protein